jgi:hypothetical protein
MSQRMYSTHWMGKRVWIRLLFIDGITDSPHYFLSSRTIKR